MTKRQIGSGRVLMREWRPGESPDGESLALSKLDPSPDMLSQ
jgi:hypothetical protein